MKKTKTSEQSDSARMICGPNIGLIIERLVPIDLPTVSIRTACRHIGSRCFAGIHDFRVGEQCSESLDHGDAKVFVETVRVSRSF